MSEDRDPFTGSHFTLLLAFFPENTFIRMKVFSQLIPSTIITLSTTTDSSICLFLGCFTFEQITEMTSEFTHQDQAPSQEDTVRQQKQQQQQNIDPATVFLVANVHQADFEPLSGLHGQLSC